MPNTEIVNADPRSRQSSLKAACSFKLLLKYQISFAEGLHFAVCMAHRKLYIRSWKTRIDRMFFDVTPFAFVDIFVESAYLDDVVNELAQLPNMGELYEVTGEFDIVSLVSASDIEEFRDVLKNRIMKIKGVKSTVSSIVLHSHKGPRCVKNGNLEKTQRSEVPTTVTASPSSSPHSATLFR